MPLIKNKGLLLHGEKRMRLLALEAFEKAVNAVSPSFLVPSNVRYGAGYLFVQKKRFKASRIFVVGFGKASGAMAEALERIVPLTDGVVVVPEGTAKRFHTKKIVLVEGTHPLPSSKSVAAAKKLLALAQKVRKGDLVVCLVSGGGSSLLELPREGVSLRDIRDVSFKLMRAGASISELNEVRRCLSQLKGGQLGSAFSGATLINLVLSDVLGSPLHDIASGPTVPNTLPFEKALSILSHRLSLSSAHPLIRVLQQQPRLVRVRVSCHSFVLGDNNTAIDAAASFLRSKGLNPRVFRGVHGEARDVGSRFAHWLNRGVSFVAGGETTVTVKGKGKGGRNHEVALGALRHLKRGVLLAAGTDGKDGVCDAAGAVVDGSSRERALALHLPIRTYLNKNDSHSLLCKTDDSIFMGLTGTNACDLIIGIA